MTRWEGCYDLGWKGLLTDHAFSHPAKFSRGLIERIVDHVLAQGWVQPGGTVADPFGGVGCGGVVCAARGLRWVGVERIESEGTRAQAIASANRVWCLWRALGPFCVLSAWWSARSWGLRLFFDTPLTRSEIVVAPVDWRAAVKADARHIWVGLGPFRLCFYAGPVA